MIRLKTSKTAKSRNHDADAMLIRGIESVHFEEVQTAVAAGANVNVKGWSSTSRGRTVLECAASQRSGTLKIAEFLIGNGATITGKTLVLASMWGNYEVAELVLREDKKKRIKYADIIEAKKEVGMHNREKLLELLDSYLESRSNLRKG